LYNVPQRQRWSSVIADRLAPELKARFPERPWKIGAAGGPLASVSSPHAEVGDLELYEEGGEITVVIGTFTHCHFGSYDARLSPAAREERIAEDVMAFLEELFADRIEFFGTGRAGGHRVRSNKGQRGIVSRFLLGRTSYVWSGPLRADG
jgi:hypothetical protein